MATDVSPGKGGAVESKGLKDGALGLASATVIGRRVDGAGIQPRRVVGIRHARGRRENPRDHVDGVSPDGLHRRRVLLPQPR